jgi:chorismate--pyruvate lyase
MSHRQVALVRETLLLVKQQAWVFARSVIPASTLNGPNRALRSLGNRSLGSWLFSAPSMRRAPFEVALIDPGNTLVPEQLQTDVQLWGRRSRFEVNQAALLVCEIFLPPFQAWPMIKRICDQATAHENHSSTLQAKQSHKR